MADCPRSTRRGYFILETLTAEQKFITSLTPVNGNFDVELEAAKERREILLGSFVVKGEVVTEAAHTQPLTLFEAAQQACTGDTQALRIVEQNVATDVAERLYKAGHQTFINLEIKNGHILQNGVALSQVHKNTLEHMPLNPVMRQRTEQEMQNAYLFEELNTAGVLEEYDVVVFSHTPTDAKTRKDYNFFTDTDRKYCCCRNSTTAS